MLRDFIARIRMRRRRVRRGGASASRRSPRCGVKGPLKLPPAPAAPPPPARRRREAHRRAPPRRVARDARAEAAGNPTVTAFSRVDGELHAEGVPLSAIAERFGTPCYVYSRAALEARLPRVRRRVRGRSASRLLRVKANSNLAVLNLLARLGSGFDIVSGGELARVIAAGGDPAKIVFSGVGKTDGRDGGRARRRHPAASTSNRPPSSKRSTRVAGRAGKRRAGLAPRESRRRPEDASRTSRPA